LENRSVRASLSTHLARKLGRFVPTRPHPVRWRGGVVSFTFDDFPKTALTAGAPILERHRARGTYYTALDLAETDGALGRMFDRQDIREAHDRGHEIGCHTFRHLDCGRAATRAVLAEVAENAAAMQAVIGGYEFASFAFPYGGTSFSAKRALAHRFSSCRGIGRGINAGKTDFADLRATPVQDVANAAGSFRRLIDEAREADGWLVFYTHDVSPAPSPFGCTPEQLDLVVAYAAAGGAVLPVREVVAALTPPPNPA
jgi:peptidoglycan/xylan/chitin deacetylase (PgdA/CDA1 family)